MSDHTAVGRAPRPAVIPLGSNGSRIEVLLPGGETAGAVCVLRWRMSPASKGPTPHFHTTFDESFLLESGSLEALVGEQWRTLRAGDVVHAPRGTIHALRKNNGEPASVLMVLTPGVPREDYFASLASCEPGEEDALHQRFDNHFV